MLYATPRLDVPVQTDLAALDQLCDELGARAGRAGPWLGSLRRQWRASSAESWIEIEGFSVPSDERLAVASGAELADSADENRMALACYVRAMDHVGVMAADEGFNWVDRVVLDLHFDACSSRRTRIRANTARRGSRSRALTADRPRISVPLPKRFAR